MFARERTERRTEGGEGGTTSHLRKINPSHTHSIHALSNGEVRCLQQNGVPH